MKATKHTVESEFEVFDAGDDVMFTIKFDRVTTFGMEHYGADADGNRGIWQECIDEDYADNIQVLFDNELWRQPWAYIPLANLALDTRARIELAVEEYMERTEPLPPDVPDEPDYEPADHADYWDNE